ncbi:hypothetical protein K439DRAFT_1664696 [Ramaria rubella]|nr:hypothetical protein K439DRAFT_1664696 [Ramaria rubella]
MALRGLALGAALSFPELPAMPAMRLMSLMRVMCVVGQVAAQVTANVTCTKDPWTANAQGVSPCLVAATLEGACNNGVFNISSLPPGDAYNGPLAGQSNICFCSTVTYSMVSACAACQGGEWNPWASWIENCVPSEISIAAFPAILPPGFVPSWAFIDPTEEGTWNATAALVNQTNRMDIFSFYTSSHASPSAEAAASPPASLSSSSLPTLTLGSPSLSPTTGSNNTSKSSSHAGAIAGGVVGGVVGLAAIALGAFLLFRRHRRVHKLEGPRPNLNGEKVDLVGTATPAPSTIPPYSPMESTLHSTFRSVTPPRLYDPLDPSTFPRTPSPSLSGYTNGVGNAMSPTNYASPYGGRGQAGYSGAAEV